MYLYLSPPKHSISGYSSEDQQKKSFSDTKINTIQSNQTLKPCIMSIQILKQNDWENFADWG